MGCPELPVEAYFRKSESASSDSIAYGYNVRSEVTSTAATNETLYNYAYSFDNIGNRLTASERGVSSSYTSNALNQYTAIDITTPTYDYDGNMSTNGSGWAYEWDGENRMKAAVSGTRRVEFAYDYMSRRVEARVYDSGTLTSHWRFVYSGYKHVETLNGANGNALLQKYLWSGDRLLATYDVANAAAYSYFIDGNKNVGQLIDASGNIVAKYEYGPFGQLTRCEGSCADANPYRFSSEQYDSTLSLVYYNYRYYSPSLGRWLSKDPIEENGGGNLYAFLSNDSIDTFDHLGLADYELHHIIAEWYAKYSKCGSRSDGLRILLSRQFHRGPGGLESGLTAIRNAMKSGQLNQFAAYNRMAQSVF